MNGSAAQGFTSGFMQGFNFVRDAKQMQAEAEYLEEQRQVERDQRKAKADLSAKIAKGPEQTQGIETPTQQTAQLMEQAGGFEDDPAVQAFEEQLYKSTGRTTAMKKDLQGFRQEYAQSLGAINDPAIALAYKDYPDELFRKGFRNNMARASTMLIAGDARGAADAVQSAMGFIEDGTVTQVMPTKDKDGNVVLGVFRVDEDTNKPLDAPKMLNAKAISSLISTLEDPVAFQKYKDELVRVTDATRLAAEKQAGVNIMNQARIAGIESQMQGRAQTNAISQDRLKLAQEAQLDTTIDTKVEMGTPDDPVVTEIELSRPQYKNSYTALQEHFAGDSAKAEAVTDRLMQERALARQQGKSANELPTIEWSPVRGFAFIKYPGTMPISVDQWLQGLQ